MTAQQTSELKLFTSNSMRGVLGQLIPEFERASGRKVDVSFDPAKIMLRRIASGEAADLAILSKGAIDSLAARKQFRARSD